MRGKPCMGLPFLVLSVRVSCLLGYFECLKGRGEAGRPREEGGGRSGLLRATEAVLARSRPRYLSPESGA